MTSQQRYLPFGQVRTDVASPNSQSLITDYGYTGQRNLDKGIGLMDYRARFYSPVLNRFIQPDSIVPNPTTPQMFNRFSYVGNNPIRFNDPSGHCGEDSTPSTGISATDHSRLCALHDKAIELSQEMKNGSITDVEALEQMMEFAAPLYITEQSGGGRGHVTYVREDTSGFIQDLGIVLGGIHTRVGVPPYELIDNQHNLGQYYAGYDAFAPNGNSGFRNNLTDGTQNQVRHFAGGLVGGSWGFNSISQYFQYGQEPEVIDQNLYLEAYELIDYLSENSLTDAGKWINQNLAKPKTSPKKTPLHIPY